MLVDINGIEVNFPFEPYELQKEYMKKVIDALNNKQNAVLESPTGIMFNYFSSFMKIKYYNFCCQFRNVSIFNFRYR